MNDRLDCCLGSIERGIGMGHIPCSMLDVREWAVDNVVFGLQQHELHTMV